MPESAYLPDVNILLALVDRDHVGHHLASTWLAGISSSRFLLCAITESGFVRLSTSPQLTRLDMRTAMALLRRFSSLPNCAYLSIEQPWLNLVAPFAARLHGYRQVTDALLLGLAIEHHAVLVTLDRGVQALAGEDFQKNLLTLG